MGWGGLTGPCVERRGGRGKERDGGSWAGPDGKRGRERKEEWAGRVLFFLFLKGCYVLHLRSGELQTTYNLLLLGASTNSKSSPRASGSPRPSRCRQIPRVTSS
jgi:hypothetical protein